MLSVSLIINLSGEQQHKRYYELQCIRFSFDPLYALCTYILSLYKSEELRITHNATRGNLSLLVGASYVKCE